MSFNFEQVIGDETWLGRAGIGLIMLAQPIVYALVCLWPVSTAAAQGWTLAGISLIASVIVARIVLSRPNRAESNATEIAASLIITLIESVTSAAGAVLVAAGYMAGVFVLSAAAIVGFGIGLVTAWALLVEVRRSDRQAH